MSHAKLRFQVNLPDYSAISIVNHDWTKTIYRNVKELLPMDTPPALGEYGILTSYVNSTAENGCL